MSRLKYPTSRGAAMKIRVIRKGYRYFHQRLDGDGAVTAEEKIRHSRALQIIESNPDGRIVEGDTSKPDLSMIAPASWTWQVELPPPLTIKPCCGRTPAVTETNRIPGYGQDWRVECQECGRILELKYTIREKAIAAWNT